MKRYVLLLLCLCMSVIVLADEHIRIKVTANKESWEESRESCRLTVSATSQSNSDDVRITILIENKEEDLLFFLFNHSYTEKDLKNLGIRFDRKSYGSTDRRLRSCNSIDGDDAVQIEPQDKHLLRFRADSNPMEIEIPVYIAKYRNSKRNKFLILRREIISLNVEIERDEENGNEEYERLYEEYEGLVSELEGQSFCPNKRHSPSLSEQEKPYRERIREIKDAISDIKSANTWREDDRSYARFKELLAKLDDIDFRLYEKDCRRHKVSHIGNTKAHDCSYSSWTANKVLSSLVQIYKKLDNGRMSKASAVEKVKSIKRELTNRSCPLYSRMNKSPDIKREVEEYCNSIINY